MTSKATVRVSLSVTQVKLSHWEEESLSQEQTRPRRANLTSPLCIIIIAQFSILDSFLTAGHLKHSSPVLHCILHLFIHSFILQQSYVSISFIERTLVTEPQSQREPEPELLLLDRSRRLWLETKRGSNAVCGAK